MLLRESKKLTINHNFGTIKDMTTQQNCLNKSCASFWILTKYYRLEQQLAINLDRYELAHSIEAIYKFLWDFYADWYIEYLKSDETQLDFAKSLFRQFIVTASPYCPFETEVLWREYFGETELLASTTKDFGWTAKMFDVMFGAGTFEQDSRYVEFENTIEFIGNIRSLKGLFAIDPAVFVQVYSNSNTLSKYSDYIKSLGKCEIISQAKTEFYEVITGIGTNQIKYQIDILQYIKDKPTEILRTNKTIIDLTKQIFQLETQLSNSKFIENADSFVILEKKNSLFIRQNELNTQNIKLTFLNK